MRLPKLVIAALVVTLPATAFAASPLPACPATKVPPLALAHLKAEIASNHQATIVALGSSSTEGWHASDVAHSYPAVLQNELNAALPSAHIAVINRGIGGQDVAEMLPRLEQDALAVHPALVIWQLGANGAMRLVAPDLFKRMLTSGIQRLHDAKIDVVLMDNQRSPAILASPEHLQIDQAMADVAVATGSGLFSRGALMDQWRVEGYPYERFVSDDGLHHNDYGYHCVASTLATAILDGLRVDIPTATKTAAAKH